jgi:hypothetical protein
MTLRRPWPLQYAGLLVWDGGFLGGRRPAEFGPPYSPYAGNENVGWNRRPFIREKILGYKRDSTYRYSLFADILRVALAGFGASRPGQASDGSPRSRSGNFAMFAAMRRASSRVSK